MTRLKRTSPSTCHCVKESVLKFDMLTRPKTAHHASALLLVSAASPSSAVTQAKFKANHVVTLEIKQDESGVCARAAIVRAT